MVLDTPTMMLEPNEDAAERRGRVRIQKRASLGPQTPISTTLKGFTSAQLSDHYSNCMKLSAENKINSKNAFHLQLIDYMSEMMRKKASDLDNFQVASCALDASAKIYAYRVDSVHSDTLKLAGGVGKNQKGDGAENDDSDTQDRGRVGAVDGEDGATAEAPRRRKKAATVEKNLNNINCSKFDLEFDVDPLFKKTSAQFDSGGGGGGQFLSTLYMRDDSCQLLLDSCAVLSSFSSPVPEAPAPVALPEAFRDGKKLVEESVEICPTFSDFRFGGWTVEADEDEAATSTAAPTTENNQYFDDEHAFDADAAAVIDEDSFMGGGGDDDMFASGQCEEGNDERGVSLALTEDLRHHLLSSASNEYSYFDRGRLGAWAGPKHWKFKPLKAPPSSLQGPTTKELQKRKKKAAKGEESRDFEELFSDMSVLLESVEKTMKIPLRPLRLQNKTMERWGDDRLVLPRDLHYRGKDFSKLFVAEFHVGGKSVGPESQSVDDTVDDYDFDNPNDVTDYCPATEDGVVEYPADDCAATTFFPTQTQEMSMVEAPNRVEKINIGYAKKAKKMDMRRLKHVEWKILRRQSSTSAEVVEVGEEDAEDAAKMDDPLNFSHLCLSLREPGRMPAKMVENLSVPLAFVALLHLCNEKSLSLKSAEDFSDFIIHQG